MTSAISVCWRLRTSVASRSSDPPRIAIAARNAACRSRWTIWVLTGSTRSPRSVRTSASMSGARWLYVPTGPLILPVAISAVASARRARPRATSNAQPAHLSPNVVGSAWTEWVRPIITVPASIRARVDEGGDEPVRVVEEPAARGAELERERRVDDVAAGQAEVEVPALGSDRLGDLRHEGDDVVVGGALDLGDARRRRRAPGPRSPRGPPSGTRPRRHLGPADRELDLEHPLEARLLRPHGAHLGQRVARDHASAPAGCGRSAAMSWRRWRPSQRDRVRGRARPPRGRRRGRARARRP